MTGLARLALLSLALPMVLGAGPSDRLIVHGRGTALGETPILVELKAPIEPGSYSLHRDGASPTPAAIYRDRGATYLAATLDSVAASGQTVYTLEKARDAASRDSTGVELRAEGKDVEVRVDGRPFTTLDATTGPKPYLFPLYGPTGKSYTRAYPMKEVAGEKRDHPHHRSLWFTHGKVNGIDFWTELKGHGRIVQTSCELADHDAVGLIRTTDDWVAPDGKVVLRDSRVARIYRAKSVRILDFDIELRAENGPITFGDTKEGMFGVRVASSMDVDAKRGGKITTSTGLTDAAAWGKPASWVDYTGPIEGDTVGIAILNRPDSFRYPTTWHVRTYGLFAANPFGWHDFGMKDHADFTVPAGKSIRFGYRLILHRGDTASAGIASAFEAYANPPTVEVVRDE